MHRAGMIGILFVDPEENLRRAIGMLARDAVGGRGREMREGVKDFGLGVVRESLVNFFHRLLPAPNAEPVIFPGRIEEECLGRRDEELFALCRRVETFRFLHFLPAALEISRARPGRPERLEQSHRDAPVRHRAVGISLRDLLESFPRLRIGHVMEQGDGAVELHLRLRRAAHGKADFSQLVAGVRVGGFRFLGRAVGEGNEENGKAEDEKAFHWKNSEVVKTAPPELINAGGRDECAPGSVIAFQTVLARICRRSSL